MKIQFHKKLRGLIAALFISTGFLNPELTLAEGNCPPGYYQTGATDFVGCAPIPGYGGAAPSEPAPEWRSRYGAIATANGAFGTANDETSAKKAEKKAMKQCEANGGKDCRVSLSFGNQCAAMAWGDTVTSSEPAADIPQAEAQALKSCGERTQNCKIYYSACSNAVLSH